MATTRGGWSRRATGASTAGTPVRVRTCIKQTCERFLIEPASLGSRCWKPTLNALGHDLDLLSPVARSHGPLLRVSPNDACHESLDLDAA